MTVVEICVDDLSGVERACAGGADRIELCRQVSCGGLTPYDEVVTAALEKTPSGGMQILVRPRPGDFIHSEDEVATICADIQRLCELTEGAAVPIGFVVGVLHEDLTINGSAAARIRETAGERPLTFHRGVDQVPDLLSALDTLIRLEYDRVLTTGGHPSVAQCDTLSQMVTHAGDQLVILASGGLRAHNVAEVIAATHVREVHMRAPARQGVGTDQRMVEEIIRHVGTADAYHS